VEVERARADRDAAVGGALREGEDAAGVAEEDAIGGADLLPLRVRERRGGDHQRVQREQPPLAVEVLRVALGAQQDDARAQPPAIRTRSAQAFASSQRRSSSPKPCSRIAASIARTRASSGALVTKFSRPAFA